MYYRKCGVGGTTNKVKIYYLNGLGVNNDFKTIIPNLLDFVMKQTVPEQ